MATKTGLGAFAQNLKDLPRNLRGSFQRHDPPVSDRARSQTVFSNVFLHVHSIRTHLRSLGFTATMGLGVAAFSLFVILLATGALLMVYYTPSTQLAYDSMKDIHFVVPTGRFIRNIHRWAAQLMVVAVLLHMCRVFYTSSYKSPREFNWLVGMVLLVLTLGLSFSGYLLPWDQLAYWAITIGSNIAGSPRELTDTLGITAYFNPGGFQKELLLGASEVGQDALTRFYLLHVIVLPLLLGVLAAVHFWRIRKDGGIGRPGPAQSLAGKGAGTSGARFSAPASAPTKTYGLMCLVRGRTPATDQDLDNTVPSWPHLFRAELVVFMICMLACVALALVWDAPLKELANPSVPENPAKAPWYFLGLQEMVSYSAFMGGLVIPAITLIGLGLIPYLDREPNPAGVYFSGVRGRRVAAFSFAFGIAAAVTAVAVPVHYGWLRNWFPTIPQLVIICVNPGSLLTLAYAVWSLVVLRRTGSTRMSAIALFSCFVAGFIILTYVGTELRGPNWHFYWSHSQWPVH